MSFWSKRIKNTKKLANKLGVEEEKIKELKNGEREITGKTIDKVMNVINEDKMIDKIKEIEIRQWYNDTDLKKLRKDFGYISQCELAKVIGCDNSVICNFENKKPIKWVSPKLIDYYNFFQDDFNKKINKKQVIKKQPIKKMSKAQKTKLEREKIMIWYKNTDIKKLRGNVPQREMANRIGCAQSSLSDIENKKMAGKRLDALKKVYEYFNKEEIRQNNLEEIYKWYTSIEDLKQYRRDFGYSLNKMMAELNVSYDQIRDFESHKYKNATNVVCKFYDFYMNEKNRKDPVVLFGGWKINEETTDNKPTEEIINNEVKEVENSEEIVDSRLIESNKLCETKDSIDITNNLYIKQLEEELAQAKRQIMLYEKLIERM